MTITPERIAELRRLHEKATPGPWWREWNNADDHEDGIDILACGHGGRIALVEDGEIPGTRETGFGPAAVADLICAARNALPELLDEIERLREDARHCAAVCHPATAEIERLRAVIRETHYDCMGMGPDRHTHACRLYEIEP